MLGFIGPAGYMQFEFEKPICIAAHHSEVEFASAQLTKHIEKAHEEIQATLRDLQERHTKTSTMLLDQLIANLKMSSLYPKDFNPVTDVITLENGVVYHARRKV